MKKLNIDKLKSITDEDRSQPIQSVKKQPSERWPSREPVDNAPHAVKEEIEQLNIRGPASIIERFKALRVHPRQPFYEVLEELIELSERNRGS